MCVAGEPNLMASTVTALCLTRDRRDWLPQAIACFQSQTYIDCKMLIVVDGENIADLIPNDPHILLVQAPGNPYPMTVGAKRNLGCSLADTEYICNWDDDDYSAPGRIADQISILESSGKSVAAYDRMKFTNGMDWWQYKGGVLGTSLCFRRSWWVRNKFNDQQVGQDEYFGFIAEAHKQLVKADAKDLMVASCHLSNTSPRVINPRSKSYTKMGAPDIRLMDGWLQVCLRNNFAHGGEITSKESYLVGEHACELSAKGIPI